MSIPFDDLRTEALRLPEKARAELAKDLLYSLDDSAESGVEEAWEEEAERRYEEIRQGLVTPIPNEQVFREARSRRR